MSEYLKHIDKSKNMEDLRSARSYNDVVIVLSRIKSASSSIFSRLGRKLTKVGTKPVEIQISEDGRFTSNTKALYQSHEDLKSVVCYSYEVQFARSLASMISNDSKMDKFRKLCDSTDATVIKAQNMVYKYLDVIGGSVEPKSLKQFSQHAEKFLSKTLSFKKLSSFVIPSPDDRVSFVRSLVLHNVSTPNEYVLPEFIVSIHADNNFDDTFSYSVSFPNRVGDDSDRNPFSKKDGLLSLLQNALIDSFEVSDIKDLGESPQRQIDSMDNVMLTYVDSGSLFIELESGVTGTEINSTLTSILKVVHSALSVSDPRSDIVHRVSVGPRGNKIIQIRLLDRNFYDMTAMGKLAKMLALDSKTFKAIKEIAGEK